jgi:hypothetical protein
MISTCVAAETAIVPLSMLLDYSSVSKVDMGYLTCFVGWTIAVGHTKPYAPDPIRTRKLSGLRHG